MHLKKKHFFLLLQSSSNSNITLRTCYQGIILPEKQQKCCCIPRVSRCMAVFYSLMLPILPFFFELLQLYLINKQEQLPLQLN